MVYEVKVVNGSRSTKLERVIGAVETVRLGFQSWTKRARPLGAPQQRVRKALSQA